MPNTEEYQSTEYPPEIPFDQQVENLRVPPHSIEAEASVLGGLLLDNNAFDRVSGLLAESDFYRYEHRIIFACLERLISASKPADAVTVHEDLQRQGKAQDAGGLPYLATLVQQVPSASNIRRYAEIVRERSILRQLVSVSDDIATRAFNPKGRPVSQILDEAESLIFKIGEESARMKQGFQPIQALAPALLERVEERSMNPSDITGVATGFIALDRMTAGFQAGDLIVLAARPSMGKTAFALNIAEHVALVEGLPVAVFSMEMGADQLTVRLIGSLAGINNKNLSTGRVSDEDWVHLNEAVERLQNAKLFIDETPGLTPSELRASARRLARQQGNLGLIVVDYLQLMSGSGSSDENRATEVGEISRALKALAKELQCPVLAISQLNRGVENRTDKRPLMSDLRESGAIEQDADIIMFIYREDYQKDKSKVVVSSETEIIIRKQRNGPTGTVKLTYVAPTTRFENLIEGADEEYGV